ncbi:sugar transferase [Glutamicibacter creatinolyticus]|uniref:sugar transferase n=1 Tax=Glutamicibacter creatinolyticus TaxID=162496 RepID=UPI0037C02F50
MTQLHDTWGISGTFTPIGARSSTVSSVFESDRSRSSNFSGLRWRRAYTRYLATTDTVIVLLVAAFYAFVVPLGRYDLWLLASVALFWALLLELRRTRDRRVLGNGAREYKAVVEASAVAGGFSAALAVVLDSAGFRDFILVALPVGTLLLLISRWSARRWLHIQAESGRALSNVIVVGTPADIHYVTRQLGNHAGPAYQVVGAVSTADPWDELQNADIPHAYGLQNLDELIPAVGADAVIVAGHFEGGSPALKDLCWQLEQTRTEIIMASSLTNVAGPRINIRPVDGLPLMHVDLPNFSGGHHLVKRLVDIVLSGSALLFLSPLMLILFALIKWDSKGPAVFSQERIGANGKPFTMYKFRSMVVNAEEILEELRKKNEGSGLLFKMKDDPRVTKVGRWIRKFSLDELPQIFNVLRGEMSLVGPRPPLPSEVECYEGHVGRRLYIKPGLTGLWQVSGRSDLEWDEGVRLDLYYVENWSLTGDIMIMWRTLKVMLKPVGAY